MPPADCRARKWGGGYTETQLLGCFSERYGISHTMNQWSNWQANQLSNAQQILMAQLRFSTERGCLCQGFELAWATSHQSPDLCPHSRDFTVILLSSWCEEGEEVFESAKTIKASALQSHVTTHPIDLQGQSCTLNGWFPEIVSSFFKKKMAEIVPSCAKANTSQPMSSMPGLCLGWVAEKLRSYGRSFQNLSNASLLRVAASIHMPLLSDKAQNWTQEMQLAIAM